MIQIVLYYRQVLMFGSYQRTIIDPGNYPDMLGHPAVVVAKGRMDAYYDKIED